MGDARLESGLLVFALELASTTPVTRSRAVDELGFAEPCIARTGLTLDLWCALPFVPRAGAAAGLATVILRMTGGFAGFLALPNMIVTRWTCQDAEVKQDECVDDV